jgi:acetoin utilization protein AcuB
MPVRVRDWMQRQVHHVRPLDSIAHARAALEEHRVNQLPVLVNGRLVGILTDRDLRDAFPSVFSADLFADRPSPPPTRSPEKIHVQEVMTENVLTLAPDAPLIEAAQIMRRQRVGSLPIVEDDRLLGIITRSDMLDAFIALLERQPK